MTNIKATIQPGKSCAGFYLGQHLSEIRNQINPSEVKTWTRANGEQLSFCIKNTADWLRTLTSELSDGRFQGESWYYSHGMIELDFGPSGILFSITVFKGYEGKLLDSIGINSQLSELENIISLVYDDADEIYLPQEGGGPPGISFFIDETTDTPTVHGISIYNFELDV